MVFLVDVWSVGCVFAELIGGKPLFKGRYTYSIVFAVWFQKNQNKFRLSILTYFVLYINVNLFLKWIKNFLLLEIVSFIKKNKLAVFCNSILTVQFFLLVFYQFLWLVFWQFSRCGPIKSNIGDPGDSGWPILSPHWKR